MVLWVSAVRCSSTNNVQTALLQRLSLVQFFIHLSLQSSFAVTQLEYHIFLHRFRVTVFLFSPFLG